MKKHLYTILVASTLLLLGCIFVFAKEPQVQGPSLKERKGNLSLSGEWLNTKKAIEGLCEAIKRNPEDYKAMLELSQAFIQEGRVSGDHAHYDKASLELLDKILLNQPENFDAICLKATVLLSQHHFSEGLVLASKAWTLNPNSAFVYGILCDACVELGKYDIAVQMADKMVSLRPDIRSYARVSYLREIYGDVDGAIQAAKLAVAAGYPGLEQTEWTRCILAHLYECRGELDSAQREYQTALLERPDYAYAIAGVGKIEKAKKNYKRAIALYERAKGLMVEPAFSDELTELYRLNKESDKAAQNAKAVIEMLGPGTGSEEENGHGHYADKELAMAYLKINDTDNALKHALLEFARRPDNIDVCETMAWVDYKRGDITGAHALIEKALRTGSKNPTLLARAGLIKIRDGQEAEGRLLIKNAIETNPFIELELKNESYIFLAAK